MTFQLYHDKVLCVENKKILIFGAGTLGTYIGTKLKDGGFDVILYGKKMLENLDQIIHINNEIKTSLPKRDKNINDEHYGVIFVTTKLYDLGKALKEIIEKNITYDVIVFIQNGFISEDLLEDIDKNKIVLISIIEGYVIKGKNKIISQLNSYGWFIKPSEQADLIRNILNRSCIVAQISLDYFRIKAEKMIVNCTVSALSVLADKTIGGLLDTDSKTLLSLIDETYLVLSSRYPMYPHDETVGLILKQLEENKSHYPSLHQDFKRHKRTEVDYFNGRIIEWAKEKGIDVPVNEKVFREFKIKENEIQSAYK